MSSPIQSSAFLSIYDLASFFRVSRQTINYRVDRGELPRPDRKETGVRGRVWWLADGPIKNVLIQEQREHAAAAAAIARLLGGAA